MILRRPLQHALKHAHAHAHALTTPPTRALHSSIRAPPTPAPTPFVPDVATFLTLIGRSLSAHAAKIPSWDALFQLSSAQLRELGVEPARSRRYLLWWRDRFRRGEYGVGGELRHVVAGVAEVRLVEAAATGRRRWRAVNVAPGAEADCEGAPAVACVKVKDACTIAGTGFEPVKGSRGKVARLRVREGLWEVRRGHKVHGGERRRKNTLSRIAARERGTLK